MPTYHFQTFCGLKFDRDLVGIDLPDTSAARQLAIRAAGEAIRDLTEEIADGANWNMRVLDESDNAIFHLSFSISQQ